MLESFTLAISILRLDPGVIGYGLSFSGVPLGATNEFFITKVKIIIPFGGILVELCRKLN